MRTERDMLGERTLGDDTLYGLQTLRAFENFGTTFPRTNLSLIYAMVQVKKAAAMSYQQIAAKTCMITAISSRSSSSEALTMLCLPPFLQIQTSPLIYSIQVPHLKSS